MGLGVSGEMELFDYYSLWLLSLDILYFVLPAMRRLTNGGFVGKRYTTSTTNKFAIFLHVITGTYLVLGGVVFFLMEFTGQRVVSEHPPLGIAYAISGFLHQLSGLLLLKKVQGERRATVPLYVAVICVNVYNSTNILHANTFENIQLLWFSVNAFVYVRLLAVAYFGFTSMDWHMVYTVSVVGAGMPTLFTLPRDAAVLFAFCFVLGGPFMEHVLDKRLGFNTVYLKKQREELAAKELKRENVRSRRKTLDIAIFSTPSDDSEEDVYQARRSARKSTLSRKSHLSFGLASYRPGGRRSTNTKSVSFVTGLNPADAGDLEAGMPRPSSLSGPARPLSTTAKPPQPPPPPPPHNQGAPPDHVPEL